MEKFSKKDKKKVKIILSEFDKNIPNNQIKDKKTVLKENINFIIYGSYIKDISDKDNDKINLLDFLNNIKINIDSFDEEKLDKYLKEVEVITEKIFLIEKENNIHLNTPDLNKYAEFLKLKAKNPKIFKNQTNKYINKIVYEIKPIEKFINWMHWDINNFHFCRDEEQSNGSWDCENKDKKIGIEITRLTSKFLINPILNKNSISINEIICDLENNIVKTFNEKDFTKYESGFLLFLISDDILYINNLDKRNNWIDLISKVIQKYKVRKYNLKSYLIIWDKSKFDLSKMVHPEWRYSNELKFKIILIK